jgi:hypothetical protein
MPKQLYEEWDVQGDYLNEEEVLQVVKNNGHTIRWDRFLMLVRWTGECGFPQPDGNMVWLNQPRAWLHETTGKLVKRPKLDEIGQPQEDYIPQMPRKVRVRV